MLQDILAIFDLLFGGNITCFFECKVNYFKGYSKFILVFCGISFWFFVAFHFGFLWLRRTFKFYAVFIVFAV